MNLTEHQNTTISRIKSSLFHGEFGVVDDELLHYDRIANDPDRRSLFNRLMGNTVGLFAFQSWSAQDDIMRMLAKRHSKVLSLWALPDQLNLIHQEIDVLHPHVLDVLKIDASALDQETRTNALRVISKLLQHDNFECVSRLCTDLGMSLHEPMDKGLLFYKTKGSRGAFSINFSHPYPLFATALFNLTVPKVDYLAAQQISLDDLDKHSSILQEKTDHVSHIVGAFGPQLEQSGALLSRLVLEHHVNNDAPARPSRVM